MGARGTYDLSRRIETIIEATSTDYWPAQTEDSRPNPWIGELPECPQALNLAEEGQASYRYLLDIVSREHIDSHRFKNALFFLLYFDSLFVWRELKRLYKGANAPKRKWLEKAIRKALVRCYRDPRGRDEARFRDIGKNTWPGRLASTPVVVRLARKIEARRKHKPILRDMAVSDGVTSLDVAQMAAAENAPVSIVATDAFLYLHFTECDGGQAVFLGDGRPLQYEFLGQIYRMQDGEEPGSCAGIRRRLDQSFAEGDVASVPMLAPEVELAVESGRYDISFREEDLFEPDPDISSADIIRIANMLVETTETHRGYFLKAEIVDAIAELGTRAKDAAYLLLNNFREKVERLGLWRKDTAGGQWVRESNPSELPGVLDGVGDIAIRSSPGS